MFEVIEQERDRLREVTGIGPTGARGPGRSPGRASWPIIRSSLIPSTVDLTPEQKEGGVPFPARTQWSVVDAGGSSGAGDTISSVLMALPPVFFDPTSR